VSFFNPGHNSVRDGKFGLFAMPFLFCHLFKPFTPHSQSEFIKCCHKIMRHKRSGLAQALPGKDKVFAMLLLDEAPPPGT